MTGDDRSEPFKDLDKRLKEARSKADGPVRGSAANRSSSGMAVGLQIAVELVAGIAVGVGVGWVLDDWLGTKPWMLLLFTIVGFVAGLMNVVRRARQLEAEQARRRDSGTE